MTWTEGIISGDICELDVNVPLKFNPSIVCFTSCSLSLMGTGKFSSAWVRTLQRTELTDHITSEGGRIYIINIYNLLICILKANKELAHMTMWPGNIKFHRRRQWTRNSKKGDFLKFYKSELCRAGHKLETPVKVMWKVSPHSPGQAEWVTLRQKFFFLIPEILSSTF